jgi:NADPH:quinone reductase-like Zn-dependent oxidoreductase
MKAMTQDAYGSADVLRLEDVPSPQPGDDEVLIRVHAAGVGPEVWHVMTGLPYLVRLMGYGLRRPKVRIPGRDVAGVVEAVGKDVVDVRPGDEVYGTCTGSFAEYACATTATIAPKPTNIGFDAAAALPTSGCAALHGLRDLGRVDARQTVVVIGASGGVGTHAVQIAKAYGAHVTGVCGGDKAALVKSLGVDNVIDYTRQDLTDGRHRFDLILDTAGRRPLSSLRDALNRHGTLVIVGGEGGGRLTGGFLRRQVGCDGTLTVRPATAAFPCVEGVPRGSARSQETRRGRLPGSGCRPHVSVRGRRSGASRRGRRPWTRQEGRRRSALLTTSVTRH